MSETNGKLGGKDALLIYSDYEDPSKVSVVCSRNYTKNACMMSFIVGACVTATTVIYAELLKRAYSKKNSN